MPTRINEIELQLSTFSTHDTKLSKLKVELVMISGRGKNKNFNGILINNKFRMDRSLLHTLASDYVTQLI